MIGGNGSGKTSLLCITAGLDDPFIDRCHVAENTKICGLEQEPQLTTRAAVQEELAAGRDIRYQSDYIRKMDLDRWISNREDTLTFEIFKGARSNYRK